MISCFAAQANRPGLSWVLIRDEREDGSRAAGKSRVVVQKEKKWLVLDIGSSKIQAGTPVDVVSGELERNPSIPPPSIPAP